MTILRKFYFVAGFNTLQNLGLNHAQTSLYLVGLNAAFILIAFSASYLGTTALFFLLLIQGLVVFFIPSAIKRKKENKPILPNPLSARSA